MLNTRINLRRGLVGLCLARGSLRSCADTNHGADSDQVRTTVRRQDAFLARKRYRSG